MLPGDGDLTAGDGADTVDAGDGNDPAPLDGVALVVIYSNPSLPVTTIATSFQFDLQGMMTHENVSGLADLKDKTILVATSGRTTWWPWLKSKYKYTDEQTRPYTFNLQPFFADKNTVQQAYPSSEPFQAKQRHAGRRQLYRKRNAVQLLANVDDCVQVVRSNGKALIGSVGAIFKPLRTRLGSLMRTKMR